MPEKPTKVGTESGGKEEMQKKSRKHSQKQRREKETEERRRKEETKWAETVEASKKADFLLRDKCDKQALNK